MSAAAQAARMYQTYEQAEYHYRQGFIGELTWRWYVFFWVWSAPRFSNVADADRKQGRAFAKLPRDVYYRRFDRVNALRALQQGCMGER
jgi:hypothetical protein